MDLVLTLGDPRGIGPEVARKALDLLLGVEERTLVLGPENLASGFQNYESVDEGQPGAAPGWIAGQAIERAIELALAGSTSAIVTGPIHKPALNEAGFDFPGHTEMLQQRSGAPEVGMLMSREGDPPLRVLLATTHVALREIPNLVTTDLLVQQTELLARSLINQWQIERPRIALCALNPHASDNGLFGDEEERVYAPALGALAGSAAIVTGPVPADTVFVRALRGEFDAIVAPYHDVGMAGFKTATFGGGVNVTLGLPFVRTSPDHGTAFDIAGQDKADPSSTVEAISLALKLADARRNVALLQHRVWK